MSEDIVYFQLRLSIDDRRRLESVARAQKLSAPMWARHQLMRLVEEYDRSTKVGTGKTGKS